jgi:proteasome lid subunit RPN8/RPN11
MPRSLLAAGGRGQPQARPSAPLPLDRAIAWTPRDPGEALPEDRQLAGQANKIFIFRDVIAGMNRHVHDGERRPRFGFIFGHLFKCPISKADYAVADTLVEAPGVLDEHSVGACLFRAWEEIQSHPAVNTALLMGWYHSHYLLGVRLSEGDLDVNRRYFDAPWQFSIVVAPREDRIHGGLFRARPRTGGRNGPLGLFNRRGRSTGGSPSAYIELFSPSPLDGADASGSAVRWANYETSSDSRQPAGRLDAPLAAPAAITRTFDSRAEHRPPSRPPRIVPDPAGTGIHASKRTGGRDRDDGPGAGEGEGVVGPGEVLLPSDQPAAASSSGPRPSESGELREPARASSLQAGGSLAHAGGGHGSEPGRVPLPLDRAVLWTPRGTSGSKLESPPPDRAAYQFFIEREALADVNRHLARGDRESRFGFLLGRLFRCPLSGRNYSVADMIVPAREILNEQASGAHLLRAWTEAQSRLGDDPGLLLGWYHSHYLLGLTLSESDFDVNRRYFGSPWQCSIVIVPDLNRALGGVFRPSADRATPEGSRPAPFYELLPDVPSDPLAPVSSAVVWTNYEADRKVQISAEEAGAPVAAQPKAPPALFGVREGRPGVPLVIPAEGNQAGLLPPRSRRIAWPVVALIVVAALAAIMLLLPDSPRSVLRGPSAGPDANPPEVPAPARDTPEYRQFLADVEAMGIAGDRYTERANDFDAERIPCPLLATGYVAADEAYVRAAASYRSIAGEPNSAATSAYERAGREIARVNTHFDASGCPRP